MDFKWIWITSYAQTVYYYISILMIVSGSQRSRIKWSVSTVIAYNNRHTGNLYQGWLLFWNRTVTYTMMYSIFLPNFVEELYYKICLSAWNEKNFCLNIWIYRVYLFVVSLRGVWEVGVKFQEMSIIDKQLKYSHDKHFQTKLNGNENRVIHLT